MKKEYNISPEGNQALVEDRVKYNDLFTSKQSSELKNICESVLEKLVDDDDIRRVGKQLAELNVKFNENKPEQ